MRNVGFSVVAALVVVCLSVSVSVVASDSIPGRIDVRIGSLRYAYQGSHETIPITAKADPFSIGQFRFLIEWNKRAMDLTDVRSGVSLQTSTGEFGQFDVTFKQVELPVVEGVRTGEMLPGLVEITGTDFHIISDTISPTEESAYTLCVLEFRTTDNRLWEGGTTDIHFVWYDCGDNLIYSLNEDTLHLAGRVYSTSDSGKIEEVSRQSRFPSTSGLTDSCFVHLARTQTIDLVMRTNYYNGQVSFYSNGFIDSRGDINLNGIENEVTDAENYARYFVKGDTVFNVNIEGSIQASDVNKDDAVLTLEDFVYLQRIIRGDELMSTAPYSKELALFSHESTTSEVSLKTGDSLGVALLLFVGESVPTLLDDNLEMVYGHDRSVTRVLIWPKMGHWIGSGPLLRLEGDLVHVDALTCMGGGIRTEVK